MRELIRTNDVALISFLEAALAAEGITLLVLDSYASVVDGSMGMVPRRLVVDDDDHAAACAVVEALGLGHELR